MAQTKKAKVKLNLRNFTLEEKVGFAKQFVSSLTGNKDFPTPTPPLKDVTATITATETALGELKNARKVVSSKMSILDDKVSDLDAVLNQLGAYVENIAKGNETLIKSAGLSVRAQATKTGIPAAPDNLAALAVNEAEMTLAWTGVSGAKSYIVQITKDPSGANGWDFAGVSTKSKMVVPNLISGTKYWFRVAAVSPAGQGPWSDPATKYAI